MAQIFVRVPEGSKWQPAAAVGLVKALVERYGYDPKRDEGGAIILGIHSVGSVTVFEIWVGDEPEVSRLADLVRSFYPKAEAVEFSFAGQHSIPCHMRLGVSFLPRDIDKYLPVYRSADQLKSGDDPLAYLTQAMDMVAAGEWLGLLIAPAQSKMHKLGIFEKAKSAGVDNVARHNNPEWYQQRKQLHKLIDKRLKSPLISISMMMFMQTPDPGRFHLLENALGVMTGFSEFGAFDESHRREFLIADLDEWAAKHPYVVADSEFANSAATFFLTADELAALWHLPHEGMTAVKLDVIRPDPTAMPDVLKGIDGILVGMSGGAEVRLPVEDRTTHTMIIGKNGTGKSSLMQRMIHEDIAAGRGVCVIDPHGELVSNILKASIPAKREDDVVVLDLAMEVDGKRYPPPLNPLHKIDGGAVSQNILSTLDRVYGNFAGTQMEYLLKLSLRTLGPEKQPTLRDVRRLFRNTGYRAELVAQSDSIDLEDDWAEFDGKGKSQQNKDTFPLFRRLTDFYDNNETLAITCHPQPINLGNLIKENKIILVNVGGRENKIGKNERQVLGAQIVSQIEKAAMTGAISAPEFMLYIDETQNFVVTPIDEMLAEVRKFKLGMVLANQFLKQLTGETQDAIEGNVGTMFSFEIGQSDARSMRHYMTTFEEEQLTALGKFKAAVSMRYQNNRQPAFLLETLPPPGRDLQPKEAAENERRIRQKSVANYTPLAYDEVIRIIKEQRGTDNLPSADDENGDTDGFSEEEI